MPATPEMVRTYTELVNFVETNREESDLVEYKPMFELVRCRDRGCTFCQPRRGQENRPGAEVGRAAVGLANGSGGWIIVGVRQVSGSQGKHEVEPECCGQAIHPDTLVHQAIENSSTPPVTHGLPLSLADGPRKAYIVRVPASPRLHGFLDSGGEAELLVRRDRQTRRMRVEEVVLICLEKEDLERNARMRREIASGLVSLVNSIRGEHSSGPVTRLGLRELVANPEYDPRRLGAVLGLSPYDAAKRLVLDLPSKMAFYHVPVSIRERLGAISGLREGAHGKISGVEDELMVFAERFTRDPANFDGIALYEDLDERLGIHDERLLTALDRYDLSLDQAWRLAATDYSIGDLEIGRLPEAVGGLASVLLDLVPLCTAVLDYYRQLWDTFGPSAFAGYTFD